MVRAPVLLPPHTQPRPGLSPGLPVRDHSVRAGRGSWGVFRMGSSCRVAATEGKELVTCPFSARHQMHTVCGDCVCAMPTWQLTAHISEGLSRALLKQIKHLLFRFFSIFFSFLQKHAYIYRVWWILGKTYIHARSLTLTHTTLSFLAPGLNHQSLEDMARAASPPMSCVYSPPCPSAKLVLCGAGVGIGGRLWTQEAQGRAVAKASLGTVHASEGEMKGLAPLDQEAQGSESTCLLRQALRWLARGLWGGRGQVEVCWQLLSEGASCQCPVVRGSSQSSKEAGERRHPSALRYGDPPPRLSPPWPACRA